jgi:hypothetical protein
LFALRIDGASTKAPTISTGATRRSSSLAATQTGSGFFGHDDGDVDRQCGADEDENLDCDCQCEEVWDVELYRGQLVNHAGFFVTAEPCRPEHRDEIVTY